jgi:hypothetical protein
MTLARLPAGLKRLPRTAVPEMGRPGRVLPGCAQIWPVPFFSEEIVKLFPQTCKLKNP